MLSASLVTLALLQSVAPQAPLTNGEPTARVIGGMLEQFGPVVASSAVQQRNVPIPLRFDLTDAWGCVRSASSAGYCRHLGVATDGVALLAVAGVPVVTTAMGSAYGPCRWAMLSGVGGSLCWSPMGLDPVAYTSWLQAQPPTWEEYSMGSQGEIRGKELTARKALAESQRMPATSPGIHPDAPRPQTVGGGYARPAQSSGASRPASSRPGGRDLP